MIKVDGHIAVKGKTFNPDEAEKRSGITFDEKDGVGDSGAYGNDGSGLGSYRSAIINFVDGGCTDGYPDVISPNLPVLDDLQSNLQIYKDAGADEVTLHIKVLYKDQCNFEFSPKLLKRLADLNITVSVVTIEDFNDD